LKSGRVNESGFEPLILRHFLCLSFGNGIRISIESGIDLTRRGNAFRNVLFVYLRRYTTAPAALVALDVELVELADKVAEYDRAVARTSERLLVDVFDEIFDDNLQSLDRR
jgi:hypothetical protein